MSILGGFKLSDEQVMSHDFPPAESNLLLWPFRAGWLLKSLRNWEIFGDLDPQSDWCDPACQEWRCCPSFRVGSWSWLGSAILGAPRIWLLVSFYGGSGGARLVVETSASAESWKGTSYPLLKVAQLSRTWRFCHSPFVKGSFPISKAFLTSW